ncbi:hypothetical protein [Saccharothrix deserti]|uniref:hypothetical protein n=1 Tax=Saccharothrix deserti TaxID=2593674 RepID=UPI00131AE424|nr:hypothetical protein [Saccharothrix deserti]
MIRKMMSAGFACAALGLVLVAPNATAAPDGRSASPAAGIAAGIAVDNIAVENWVTDFKEPGVRIRTRPRLDATVVGLGNPGDRAGVIQAVEGDAVTCPDGSRTTEWRELANSRTGVTGFVSICYVY